MNSAYYGLVEMAFSFASFSPLPSGNFIPCVRRSGKRRKKRKPRRQQQGHRAKTSLNFGAACEMEASASRRDWPHDPATGFRARKSPLRRTAGTKFPSANRRVCPRRCGALLRRHRRIVYRGVCAISFPATGHAVLFYAFRSCRICQNAMRATWLGVAPVGIIR